MNLLKSLLEVAGMTSIGMIGGAALGFVLGSLFAWLVARSAAPGDPLDGLPIVLFAATLLGMAGGSACGFITGITLSIKRHRGKQEQ